MNNCCWLIHHSSNRKISDGRDLCFKKSHIFSTIRIESINIWGNCNFGLRQRLYNLLFKPPLVVFKNILDSIKWEISTKSITMLEINSFLWKWTGSTKNQQYPQQNSILESDYRLESRNYHLRRNKWSMLVQYGCIKW